MSYDSHSYDSDRLWLRWAMIHIVMILTVMIHTVMIQTGCDGDELWFGSRHHCKLHINVTGLRSKDSPVSQCPSLSTLTGVYNDWCGQEMDSLSTVSVPVQWLSWGRCWQKAWWDSLIGIESTLHPHSNTIAFTATTHSKHLSSDTDVARLSIAI